VAPEGNYWTDSRYDISCICVHLTAPNDHEQGQLWSNRWAGRLKAGVTNPWLLLLFLYHGLLFSLTKALNRNTYRLVLYYFVPYISHVNLSEHFNSTLRTPNNARFGFTTKWFSKNLYHDGNKFA
jgi:hypothetical protein